MAIMEWVLLEHTVHDNPSLIERKYTQAPKRVLNQALICKNSGNNPVILS